MHKASLLLAIVLAMVLFGCGNKDATKAGTLVLEWDPSKSDRASFPKAKIGAKTTREVRMKLEPPKKGGPIDLKLTIEYAPVDLEEDGKTVHHTSVVGLRVVVDRNEDWTVTAKCDGPDYQWGAVGADGKMDTPEAMILRCDFILKYGPDFTYARSLWMQGDRELKPEGPPDVKVTIDG